MSRLSISTVLLTLSFYFSDAFDWDYSTNIANGLDGWVQRYPECNGSRQSPINIDRETVRFRSSLTTFELPGYESIPRGAHWELVNNGHILQILLNGDYRMREGGLSGEYRAVQMDFHWGHDQYSGSEHTINNTHFPLELQIIHFNTKYGSYDEAMTQPDGLANFAFFFRVKEHDNPIYAQIVNKLENVAYKGEQITLRPVPLLSLLPINLNNYYRYEGSMTSPPCTESVTWTVFADVVEISMRQYDLLRTSIHSADAPENKDVSRAQSLSKSPHTRILTSCRAVQPLGYDRVVYSSNMADATFWTAPLSPISITLATLLGFVILFLVLGRQQETYEIGEPYNQGGDVGEMDNDLDNHLD